MAKLTNAEREWLIENYRRLGPTRIAEKIGKTRNAIQKRARTIRDELKAAGDSRWRDMDATGVVRRSEPARVSGPNLREKIIYYGSREIPKPIEGKYGICPPWLVVTFPAYQLTLGEVPCGGGESVGGGWQSGYQCKGRDVGAVHDVSTLDTLGFRVG